MILQRTEQTEYTTFGQLTEDDGSLVCVTLELPWEDNKANVSCIPAGTYTAARRYSPKHACVLFGLTDVPDRSDIEIHTGNFPKDTDGCILVGTKRDVVNGQDAISESRIAFANLMDRFNGVDQFTLTINDVPGAIT